MGVTVFVVGVTGQQGGAVTRALLDLNKLRPQDPIIVHALIRPGSPIPKDFFDNPKVKIFRGDFDDIISVKAAATSCDAAFLNVSPVFTDSEDEARHGRNLVDACASVAGLKRVIYSSSGALHRPVDDEVWSQFVDKHPEQWMSVYMKSKQACEGAVIQSSSQDFEEGWAIVRANTFFSNFLAPATKFMYPELETKQSITTAIRPDLQLYFLDHNDLGTIMADMLVCKTDVWNKTWKGKFVPVSKESMTLGQFVEKMNTALENTRSKKRIDLIQLDEKEAKARADKGDMVVASQIFQNNCQRSIAPHEFKTVGIDVDKMASADEYFRREADRLVQTVGGA